MKSTTETEKEVILFIFKYLSIIILSFCAFGGLVSIYNYIVKRIKRYSQQKESIRAHKLESYHEEKGERNFLAGRIKYLVEQMCCDRKDNLAFKKDMLESLSILSKDKERGGIERTKLFLLLEKLSDVGAEIKNRREYDLQLAEFREVLLKISIKSKEHEGLINFLFEREKKMTEENEGHRNYLIGAKKIFNTHDLTLRDHNYRMMKLSKNIENIQGGVNNSVKDLQDNAEILKDYNSKIEGLSLQLLGFTERAKVQEEEFNIQINLIKAENKREVDDLKRQMSSTKELTNRLSKNSPSKQDLKKAVLSITSRIERAELEYHSLGKAVSKLSEDVKRYLNTKVSISANPDFKISSSEAFEESFDDLNYKYQLSLEAKSNLQLVKKMDQELSDRLEELGF